MQNTNIGLVDITLKEAGLFKKGSFQALGASATQALR